MLRFVSSSARFGAGKARRTVNRPAWLTLAAIFTTLTALQPVSAGWFDPEPRHPRRHYQHSHPVSRGEEKAEPVKQPSGLLYAVVSIADQHVTFYDANGVWAQSIVSTGVDAHPTPTGVFTILEKERWHHSNIYSGAPMPFMERITWTGVAMHEGVVTGRPASHGCVRLPGDFARKLFGVTVPGERVIISSQEVLPADISHPHLPLPKLLAAPSAELEGSKSPNPVAPVALNSPATKDDAAPALLNPLDFAKALKAAAESKIKAAAQVKKQSAVRLDAKEQEVRMSARDVASAEESVRRVRSELDDATRAAEKAQGDDAIKLAADKKAAADAKLAEAGQKLQTARDAQSAKEAEVRSLEDAIRDAEAATATAAQQIKDVARRLEPVSIFISRKTGKLYVRQATQHLLEVPITIRDPERPIGTHLFVATKAAEDGSSLRWVGLTPPAAAEVIRQHHRRKDRQASASDEMAPIAAFPETATGALDRIEIPQEAAAAISELLWTGATLLISDVPMSEGKFAMDFQVLTRTVVHEY